MNATLKIKNKSFLMAASGEGAALIDDDLVYQRYGFPFIPARRIKGLLRESAIEMIEMEFSPHNSVNSLTTEVCNKISRLFGLPGTESEDSGKLQFSNAFVEGWDEIIKEWENTNAGTYLLPDDVKSYFTREIQQTALDEEEIAKERSLRNYRTLKPGFTFECRINKLELLNNDDITLLQKAADNLRYMGTRRNRGFGKINCELINADALMDEISNAKVMSVSSPTSYSEIEVSLTTKSPVILARQLGDQNTVFTETTISGNRLRGILANEYIKRNALKKKAHTDPTFREIFLLSKLKFGNLHFREILPVPLNVHYFKGDRETPAVNVFEKENYEGDEIKTKKDKITKPVGGFGILSDPIEKFEADTVFFFHNTRKDRTAGRNTMDDDGGIFYYQALEEGQQFKGSVTGDAEAIQKLLSVFGIESFVSRLGKSKSAQYGEVEIKLAVKDKSSNHTVASHEISGGVYLLTCISPLLLLNTYGQPEPNKKNLTAALDIREDQVENAAALYTVIEQYNSVWQSKSDKMPAYEAGSAFKITGLPETIVQEFNENYIGHLTEQGYGRVKIEPYANYKTNKWKLQTEEKISSVNEISDDLIFTNEILQKILDKKKKELTQVELKTQAIKESKIVHQKNKIKNHLASRLINMLTVKNKFDEIKTWLKELEGRPAEKTLKDTNVLDSLKTGNTYRNKPLDGDENYRLYWSTFFKTIRLRNKKE